MKRIAVLVLVLLAAASPGYAQQGTAEIASPFGTLLHLSDSRTRSISPENLTGEKGRGGMATLWDGTAAGAARELGQGWKVQPFVVIEPGETFTLGEIQGSGVIQQIWMTVTGDWRYSILRMYWDDEPSPSVESPVGDFFAQGWGAYAHINSVPINVNPGSGFNSWWPKPFRQRARLTMTNIDDQRVTVYYQINYALTEVGPDVPYFHAQFRRTNPTEYGGVHTVVDGIRGKGHYVGTYLMRGANSPGPWGEGEVRFYLDGPNDFATRATGEEDYFLGSSGYQTMQPDGSREASDFTTPFAGFHNIDRFGSTADQRRFGQYRWHIPDPIRFDQELNVTIRPLGWRSEGRHLPLQDDMASVAFWYQREPHNPFPALPAREELGISWQRPLNHIARNSSVQLEHQPDPHYNQDVTALLSGQLGRPQNPDERWLGFQTDFVAVVDLGSSRAVHNIAIRFMEDQSRLIFYPEHVEILASHDGRTYQTLERSVNVLVPRRGPEFRRYGTELPNQEMRYIKIVGRNMARAPDWHPQAGDQTWLLTDQIFIR
jgi:hypothetical protein